MTDRPSILLDTSIDYTSWDINEAGSIEMTEASRVQRLLNDQNAEIDRLKNRIEKLQNALRWICGSGTVQYDKNRQIDFVRMNWKYRDLARRTLEGDYWKDDPVYEPKSIQRTLYINIGANDVYVEAFSLKAAADYWANYRVKKPIARLMVDVEYNEGDGVND